MSQTSDRLLHRLMHGWEANFIRHPWLVIVLFILGCGLTLRYTLDNLKINTNTGDMISLELPFQKNRIALEQAFPQDIGTALLLVEGKTPEATSAAVKQIAVLARQDSAHFSSVYVPDEGDFYARNGLLYLGLDGLEDLTKQLANAQPFIGRLAEDNSLRGLFGIVGEGLEEAGKSDLTLELDPLLVKIREALAAVTADQPYRVSWRQLMTPDSEGLGVTKRLILVKPVLHYEEVMPAAQAIQAINGIIAETLKGDLAEVQVRKTGEVMLEHEEMETISNGVSIASIASLILVCLTLWIAYRSVKLMFATFVSLTMGLIFSLGFATVAIGQLNLISIGFAVLFIGMGDAYSSHFCLRYRELVLEGHDQRKVLQDTLTSTGPALILSAITAAIGLFAFIPTSYSGVAELGIIAGASMFIALATTFTVLPALMKIMPIHPPRRRRSRPSKSLLSSNWPLRYAKPVRILTLVLAGIAAVLVTRVQVDFNPINLRDPNTESVQTFKYLLQSEDTSPMTLAALAHDEAEASRREDQFRQLPTVDKVVSLKDLIPGEQDEKLEMIADLSLMMGAQLSRFPEPVQGGATLDAVNRLHEAVRQGLASGRDTGALAPLHAALSAFEARLDAATTAEERQALLERLQDSLLNPLPAVIRELGESLSAEPITRENLPKELVDRWVSANGLYRLQVYPKKDLNELENLREFILEAQRVDPDVTDIPVTYLESMNEVIKAFQQAFSIAFLATTLILLLVLRNIKDTLLVLLPLMLASLFTAAATVIFKVPFNFANIIALPLLFGLGVDSGIHMAHRLHELEKYGGSLLGTSEAKGVFYGALTTVFSFSSLALTDHQGTASMGLLLSIGLMLTLVCSLVVLPAFSNVQARETR
jgi:hopanoid biosynthesis associated RND transporter like protein HpnN